MTAFAVVTNEMDKHRDAKPDFLFPRIWSQKGAAGPGFCGFGAADPADDVR